MHLKELLTKPLGLYIKNTEFNWSTRNYLKLQLKRRFCRKDGDFKHFKKRKI